MKKKLYIYTLISLFIISLASCSSTKSTSKGQGGHCPAYGN